MLVRFREFKKNYRKLVQFFSFFEILTNWVIYLEILQKQAKIEDIAQKLNMIKNISSLNIGN